MKNWILTTKHTLIKNERERIILRAKCWENIVNLCTNTVITRMNDKMNIANRKNAIDPFIYKPSETEMSGFLRYLFSWNGLNMKLIHHTKQPKTIKEYEKKSKNWAAQCIAREYAKHLYPNMIKAAEQYAHSTSQKLCNQYKKCEKLVYDIFILSYLVKLCETQVAALHGRRSLFLLCDNSIKRCRTNITREIFQSFAKDHNYNGQFPSHRKEAIDVFTYKIKAAFQSLLVITNGMKKPEIENINVVNKEKILDLMDFIATNCKTDNGNRVIIDRNNWNVLQSVVQQMEESYIKNQENIDALRQIIIKLESFNNLYKNKIKMECDANQQMVSCESDNILIIMIQQ